MSSRSLRSPERKRLAIEGRESRKAKEERGLIPTSALEEEIGQRQRKRKSRFVCLQRPGDEKAQNDRKGSLVQNLKPCT